VQPYTGDSVPSQARSPDLPCLETLRTLWEHVIVRNDLDSASPRTERVVSGLLQHKRRQRWRHIAIASVVAAALIVGANLYYTPAHTYDKATHQAAWLAAVQSLAGKNECSSPQTDIMNLAGVGRIAWVCVTSRGQKSVMVSFWKSTGQEGSGLAYGSPPYDTCDAPLGGPWWQIGPFDPAAMSCQRGFTFTPGP
jgi:hypothetical protein